MSIDLFHIDYGRLVEVLISIVVFSFIIERALSVIFESQAFIDFAEGKPAVPEKKDDTGNVIEKAKPETNKKKGIREIIAVIVCVGFCWWQGFDAISIILQSSETPTAVGIIVTGLVIAGGSKGSLALFKDLMGFMSSAERARQEAKKLKTQP